MLLQLLLVTFPKVCLHNVFQEDAWKSIAKSVEDRPGVLLAVVGVQDAGDKLNDDLRERFGVSAEDFPVFKLFRKNKETKNFSGEVTEDALKLFLKNEAGFWMGLKGCLEDFDKVGPV